MYVHCSYSDHLMCYGMESYCECLFDTKYCEKLRAKFNTRNVLNLTFYFIWNTNSWYVNIMATILKWLVFFLLHVIILEVIMINTIVFHSTTLKIAIWYFNVFLFFEILFLLCVQIFIKSIQYLFFLLVIVKWFVSISNSFYLILYYEYILYGIILQLNF